MDQLGLAAEQAGVGSSGESPSRGFPRGFISPYPKEANRPRVGTVTGTSISTTPWTGAEGALVEALDKNPQAPHSLAGFTKVTFTVEETMSSARQPLSV